MIEMKWSWFIVTSLVLTVTLAKLNTREVNQVHDVRSVGYTAAVVEFSPVATETDPASLVTAVNLAEFINYIEKAKTQNADIVVLPEYGMTATFPAKNRDLARDFSQIVPDPSLNEIPCVTYDAIEYEAMKRLSCAARDNNLYVVVNLLEREECLGCAEDDLLIFNTNVAFDRTGAVVARYRKFNLFAEIALNSTKEPDISYFDADFGVRMGLITCFDIMFERPAVTLVREYNVTDVIFPTAWGQELPFLTALQTQAAWSYSLDVNLLASGYNNPIGGSSGSGIYGGLRHGAIATAIHEDICDELIVANIEGSQKNQSKYNSSFRGLYMAKDILTNYVSQLLPSDSDQNSLELCHGTFCCSITYQFYNTDETTNYHFLVYDGFRTHAEGMYPSSLQVCAIVACSGTNKTSCADGLDLSTYSLDTQFNVLKVNGENFKSDRVWPNTLQSNSINPLNIQDFIYNKTENSGQNYYSLEIRKSIKSIHTFGLYSHDFESSAVSLNISLKYLISLIVIVLTLKQIY